MIEKGEKIVINYFLCLNVHLSKLIHREDRQKLGVWVVEPLRCGYSPSLKFRLSNWDFRIWAFYIKNAQISESKANLGWIIWLGPPHLDLFILFSLFLSPSDTLKKKVFREVQPPPLLVAWSLKTLFCSLPQQQSMFVRFRVLVIVMALFFTQLAQEPRRYDAF